MENELKGGGRVLKQQVIVININFGGMEKNEKRQRSIFCVCGTGRRVLCVGSS